MEKLLFSLDKVIGVPSYLPGQIISFTHLLTFIANSILMNFKLPQTGFYSVRVTPLTVSL